MLFDLPMCFKKFNILHPTSIYKGNRPSSPKTAAFYAKTKYSLKHNNKKHKLTVMLQDHFD